MDVCYVLTRALTIQELVGGSVQFAQGVSGRTVPSIVLGAADAILIANFVDKLLFTMYSVSRVSPWRSKRSLVTASRAFEI